MERENNQKRPGEIITGREKLASREELKRMLNEVLPKVKLNSAKVKMVA